MRERVSGLLGVLRDERGTREYFGAFDSARQSLGDLVPRPLWEHHQRMFGSRTLQRPIRLW